MFATLVALVSVSLLSCGGRSERSKVKAYSNTYTEDELYVNGKPKTYDRTFVVKRADGKQLILTNYGKYVGEFAVCDFKYVNTKDSPKEGDIVYIWHNGQKNSYCLFRCVPHKFDEECMKSSNQMIIALNKAGSEGYPWISLHRDEIFNK